MIPWRYHCLEFVNVQGWGGKHTSFVPLETVATVFLILLYKVRCIEANRQTEIGLTSKFKMIIFCLEVLSQVSVNFP